MTDEITVKTNNVPRNILYGYELTAAERAQFDYLDDDELMVSASFIRYKRWTYDLGEFMTTSGLPEFNPLTRWDGYHSDSFFSGIVIRYCSDYEKVIMGTFFA